MHHDSSRLRASVRVGTLVSCLTGLAAAQGGLTSISSVTMEGGPASADARFPDISANGRVVGFSSLGDDFVPGDTNASDDVFVHDRLSGLTTRISVSSEGVESNARSRYPALSDSGRYVAFVSLANTLTADVVAPGTVNVYLRDRLTQTTTILSSKPDGKGGDEWSTFPRISADGAGVAFISLATDLVPGDSDDQTDVYLANVQAGTLEHISVGLAGASANAISHEPDLSGDARFVTFTSWADNLVAGDSNGYGDIFLRDRQLGVTTRISVTSDGQQATGGESFKPSISKDGAWIVFTSKAIDLVPGDDNGLADIFLHEVESGITTRISTSETGEQADSASGLAAISADGAWIAFTSAATNLVPGDDNQASDLFRYERDSGTLELVSVSSEGVQADGGGVWPRISGDGQVMVLESSSTNLVVGDENGLADVIAFDRTSCPMPARYCTSKLNSLGCVPRLEWDGTLSISGPDDFHVRAWNMLSQQPGILVHGIGGEVLPLFGGALCVFDPLRTPPQHSDGNEPPGVDCSGVYDFHLDNAFLQGEGYSPGDLLYLQYWSRDPGFVASEAAVLSRGLQLLICP